MYVNAGVTEFWTLQHTFIAAVCLAVCLSGSVMAAVCSPISIGVGPTFLLSVCLFVRSLSPSGWAWLTNK